jgi:hypothetical protein
MSEPVDTSKPADPSAPAPAPGAAPRGPRRDVSLGDQVVELKDLVLAYFRQETLDPVTALGKFVLWGVLGAVLIGLGVMFLAMAGLRALQTETGDTFEGNWSWVPYLIVVVALVIGGLLSWKLGRRRRM